MIIKFPKNLLNIGVDDFNIEELITHVTIEGNKNTKYDNVIKMLVVLGEYAGGFEELSYEPISIPSRVRKEDNESIIYDFEVYENNARIA